MTPSGRICGTVAGICIMLALSGVVYAGRNNPTLPPQPLTLEKAISYGIHHNRALQSAREDVLAADQQVKQARSGFLPKLDASYSVTHLKDQPFVAFADSDLQTPTTKLPTGYHTTNRWVVELLQPLFTGFGTTAQLKISKMNREITEYQLEAARLDLVRSIQHAFLQTLLSERLLQVAVDNVKSLDLQRRNAQANFQQGLAAENDVLKAEVALAEAQQQERTAERQRSLERSQLNQLLDIDLATELDLADIEMHSYPIPSLEALFAKAERLRPDYLAFDTAIRQTEEAIVAAKSRYYPQVYAFGQYYREGEDFLAGTNIYTNSQNAAVGLRVDWNWFEGGRTHAAVQELRYRQKSLQEKQRDLKQQIHVEVKDAVEQILVAQANLATAEKALAQANENERITTLQYKEQLVIFLEVLNAQVFVLQSRINYHRALYGYQLAWADLERAVGGPMRNFQW